MAEINIRMNPFLAEAMVEMVEQVLQAQLPDRVDETANPMEDPDLRSLWMQGLSEEEDRDAAQLLYLLRHRKFGRRAIELEDDAAECVLRACSAVRLRILDLYLSEVPSEQLEVGLINQESLQPEQQRSYACYLLLATLQSLIINQLYPDLDGY